MVDHEKIVIFLGAGASKGIGLPDTLELQSLFDTRVLSKIKDDTPKLLYQDIINYLGGPKANVDIEQIYTILARRPKEDKDIVSTQDYALQYFLSNFGYYRRGQENHVYNSIKGNLSKFETDAQRIMKSIEDFLIDIFWERSRSIPYAQLRPFFESLFKKYSPENCSFVTTNYDLVIEHTFQNHLKKELNDGFIVQNRQFQYSPDTFHELKKPKLIKVHGSINWIRTENNTIFYTTSKPDVNGIISSEKIKEFVIQYPVEGKIEYTDPLCNDMLTLFNTELELSEKLIIIGCSFRDPLINKIILNHIGDGSIQTLIGCGPDTRQILKRRFKDVNWKTISYKINPYNFPERQFLNDVDAFLQS